MSKVQVKGAVVFITGTNRKRGMGRALVEEAIRRGAKKVYATARKIEDLADLARKYPGAVVPVSLDLTQKVDIEQAVKNASDTQILINNSGFAGSTGICFNYDESISKQEFEVNYFGTLRLIQAFCSTLIKNNNTAIVNIVSIGGLFPFPMCATYSASKAAAHSITQTVRAELAHHAVSVFGVYPGPIDTDMADGIPLPKETSAKAANRIFDGIEQGIEDITTDGFADSFVQTLRTDPKTIEKDVVDYVHRMPTVS